LNKGSTDWLGFTTGHVRSMLITIALRGGLVVAGIGAVVAMAFQRYALDFSNTSLVISVSWSLTYLFVCVVAFWGTILRWKIAKLAAWCMTAEMALGPLVILISSPGLLSLGWLLLQVILLFFMVRGLLSQDLRMHYANRHY
jgi:hypothetical protein